MTYIGEEFQKRFKTLPQDIQEALTAVATVDTIFAIGKKHGLMVDQIGKMADEIWKVMLGLANPKDFIRNLASVLGIDSTKASAIASDINAQIFQPMQESLRRLYDSSIPPAAPVTPPSPPYIKGGDEEEEDNKIPPLKLRGVRGVTEKGEEELSKSQLPSMIYPQDRFEEEFKKEEIVEDKEKEEKKEAPDLPAKPARTHQAGGQVGQSAPLVPSIVEGPPPPAITPSSPPYLKGEAQNVPPLKVRGGEEELLYPKKTKEVSREPAAGQGGYKSRDPYRESTEE